MRSRELKYRTASITTSGTLEKHRHKSLDDNSE
jgi:hypothetical protein